MSGHPPAALLAVLGDLIGEGLLLGTGDTCTAATARAGEILGIDVDKLVGSRMSDLAPGFGESSAWTALAVDGRELAWRARPLGAGGFAATVADVTATRRAGEEVEAERSRLARAQAAARIGTWELDLATGVVWGTPEAFTVYGIEPTANATMPLSQIQQVPMAEERPRLDEAMRRLIADGTPYDVDFQIRRPSDQRVLTVRSRADLERDRDGRPVRVLGTVQDVTEHAEAERRASRAERLAAVGQLAGGIAHDFNNVLTAVGGYLQLIEDEVPKDDSVAADFAEVHLALDRARDLVAQLLAFAGRQRREPTAIQLGEVVARMAPMLRRVIGSRVDVVVEDAAPGALVMADAGQMEQVVLNLAINARDAMPGGGRVVIRTERVCPDPAGPSPAGGSVRLTVSDTGVGIDPEAIGRIFEPFFTTKGPARGTGMGLAVVHGIVAQSGGSIEVVSELGSGTSFRVCLPERQGLPAKPAAERAPEPVVGGAGEHVLLAEDSAAILGFASRTLERAGFRVTTAADGLAALEVLDGADGPVDVLVTDLAMPNLAGPQLAKAARARSPRTAIVFASGFGAPEVGDAGPADGFLAKPYSAEGLLRAVRLALADQRRR